MPRKNLLEPYHGKLSPEQIAEGMNAAIANARRLAEDARLLLASKRYSTAASLAILSIEEAGKVTVLRELALVRDDGELREAWRSFRTHTDKNVMWLLPQLLARGARKLDDFARITDPSSDHPQVLDAVKQLGFYTDCLGEAHWSIPADVVDENLARLLVEMSEVFAGKQEVRPREIELWIKHLQPVWKSNPAWIKGALKNWYAEMQAEGLAPPGPNELEGFIEAGIAEPEAPPNSPPGA